NCDKKDHDRQIYKYVVTWPDDHVPLKERADNRGGGAYDYSYSILNNLDKSQREEFQAEITNYIKKGWWERPSESESDRELLGNVCTFPVAQSALKTTKVRPCTDCRALNKYRSSEDKMEVVVLVLFPRSE
ncbi:hypothetical protein FOL47_005143, partial [Perkinsus chesapeaki]